jgi:membrane protease YdiL (CAAX protease family)
MLFVYILLVSWVLFVSFACLRWLEGLPFSSLGYDFRKGSWREVLAGVAIAALMVAVVVAIQIAGGGTRISVNQSSFSTIWAGLAVAFLVLTFAAAFEELLFRGYAFQTLLRGVPVWVPILILSVFFGAAHWSNPDRTLVSTANTILAGIWLAAAYLRTRGLWFPTALHFAWNWTMGAFFGLPVSGLNVVKEPLLHSTSGAPVWLTGGPYGCEGGVAATVILAIAIVLLARPRRS